MKTRRVPGTAYVLKNARTRTTSLVIRNTGEGRSEMMRIVKNRSILEIGKFVFLRIATGIRNGGVVTRRDGMLKTSVAALRNAINDLKARVGDCVSCDRDCVVGFQTYEFEKEIGPTGAVVIVRNMVGGRMSRVAMMMASAERSLKDLERLYLTPGSRVPFKAAYRGKVEEVVKVNAMIPVDRYKMHV